MFENHLFYRWNDMGKWLENMSQFSRWNKLTRSRQNKVISRSISLSTKMILISICRRNEMDLNKIYTTRSEYVGENWNQIYENNSKLNRLFEKNPASSSFCRGTYLFCHEVISKRGGVRARYLQKARVKCVLSAVIINSGNCDHRLGLSLFLLSNSQF